MRLEGCLELILCLAVTSMVNSQSEEPTTEAPRDYLFAKPRNFVLHRATNKTRFTAEEKALIVQIHNAYRSLVQPPATNMQELAWDDDLEEYAWNTTQSCTGAHSAGTMLKKYRPQFPQTWRTLTAMGEVLYYRHGPYYSIEEALWMFWAEGIDYDIENHKCAPGKECGHYRVVTLARSGGVGCAINVCKSFTVSRYPTPAVFLACSYDGRYLIYYKPYKVGVRGSDCKETGEYPYYRNGLCKLPRDYWLNRGYDGNTSVVGLPSPYPTPESFTPLTLQTTDSDVEVTRRQEDNTSETITSSQMETDTSESTILTSSTPQETTSDGDTTTTLTNSTTQETTSGGDTITYPHSLATDKTDSSTYTSTKHTRSVNRSCRSCTSLPASVLKLLFSAIAIVDYIFNLAL